MDRVLDDLDALARARAFIDACAGMPEVAPGFDWSFRVHVVGGRSMRELGWLDRVAVGERLSIEIINHSIRSRPALYINVIEHGVDGRTRVLNRQDHPAGMQVSPGTKQPLFWVPEREKGLVQEWPPDAPWTEARLVTWYIIASELPMDLGAVATPSNPREKERATSAIPSMSASIGANGQFPGFRAQRPHRPDVSWCCRRFCFILEPTPAENE
ncbi:MAG: hypothetical protein HC927_11775 [Deltaproteobacteria bacterium]|nr:hypothetical protein [Deltaproteobacteria bacterium]